MFGNDREDGMPDPPIARDPAPMTAPAPDGPASVMLIDDHPIVIAGLRLLIDGHRAYRVIGEAASAENACLIAARDRPDFIIADIVLGGRDGADLVEDLLTVSPRSRILSYSSLDDGHAVGVIRAGARGYVCKADGLQQVADALDCLARGGIWASERMLRQLAVMPSGGADPLSKRERQVYELIGQDMPLQGIARKMGLSAKTVGTYRDRLKIKLGLDTVRELEHHARQHAGRRETLR